MFLVRIGGQCPPYGLGCADESSGRSKAASKVEPERGKPDMKCSRCFTLALSPLLAPIPSASHRERGRSLPAHTLLKKQPVTPPPNSVCGITKLLRSALVVSLPINTDQVWPVIQTDDEANVCSGVSLFVSGGRCRLPARNWRGPKERCGEISLLGGYRSPRLVPAFARGEAEAATKGLAKGGQVGVAAMHGNHAHGMPRR